MRIAHVVVTDAFAGTERYVADVARDLGRSGHEVTVFGGSAGTMPALVGDDAAWRAAATPLTAARALRNAGRFDIIHAHLTYAEAVATILQSRHRGPIVATRHIAARRGSTRAGRVLAPLIQRRLSREIAISEFVADSIGLRRDQVLHNGVDSRDRLWSADSRVVLMAQRLEHEKDTATGIRAWQLSGLGDRGWRLEIAGVGAERPGLDELLRTEAISGVTFLGQVDSMEGLWRRTGVLLASAPAEPLGLTVLEAMAAGVPVVATAAGGHLETVLRTDSARGFPVGDAVAAAELLRALADDDLLRAEVGAANQSSQRASFDIEAHVRQLVGIYDDLLRSG